MDEITKVTSDAQGRFSVSAPDGGQILLHVTHKGADYFKSVPPGHHQRRHRCLRRGREG